MKILKLHMFLDYHDCETCGSSSAEGFGITYKGKFTSILEPLAHCYDTQTYRGNIVNDVLSLIDEPIHIVKYSEKLKFKPSHVRSKFVLFENKHGDAERVYFKGKLIFRNSVFLKKSYYRKDSSLLEVILAKINIKLLHVTEKDPYLTYYDGWEDEEEYLLYAD